LQGNEKVSTNAAINRVANHAGAQRESTSCMGATKTEGEIRSEHRDGVMKEGIADDMKEVAQMATEGLPRVLRDGPVRPRSPP